MIAVCVMPAAAPREERAAVGVASMALAAACFTGIDSSAKWLILAGFAPLQVVSVRYAVHFAIALAGALPRGGLAAFRSNAPRRQLLRSLCLLGATVCNFFALQFLPLTITTTIYFASPIVVTLLAIPVLGEQVGVRRIVAVCVGFGGVVVVMQPWGAEFHPAMFLSLGSMLCVAGYFVMTRLLAGVESNTTSQLWSSGLATLAIAPFGLAAWQWPAQARDIAVMFAIGAFGALGHVLATYAHRLADASILAPVVYLQLLVAGAVGYFVFATLPTVWTLAGGLIIIGCGIYIWRRERRGRAPLTEAPAPGPLQRNCRQ